MIEEVNHTRQILKQARELIKAGWCQMKYEHHGCYCMVGAVQMATFGETGIDESEVDDIFYEASLEHLREVLSVQNLAQICDWNDLGARTQDEVIAAFDKAIEKVAKP